MTKISKLVTELIGNTPIIKLNHLTTEEDAELYVKLEFFNVGGSVKDRIANSLINGAEEAGVLKPGDTIIEASSGNTGVGLAMITAAKNYQLIIVLPESVSQERKQLIRAYGAQVIETPAAKGIKGSFEQVEKLIKEHGYLSLRQFENEHNPKAHYTTTGPEIFEAFDFQVPDVLVAGVGTGGTITGAGEYLREQDEKIQLVAVEPAKSPVLSGGDPGPHGIQGIGAGVVPKVLNTEIYDEVFQVSDEEAIQTMRKVAAEEGLLLGISSGAAIFAASKLAKRLGKGKKVLAIAPDNGERYLSVGVF